MTATMKRLDHVNVRTANLDDMTEWYGRVLGMHPGARPNFGVPGVWLYVGGDPVVHLIGVETQPGSDPKDLQLEHFALSATGLKDLLAQLDADGQEYFFRPVPEAGVVQVNFSDPDGNHIHVDFDLAETAGVEI
ncbi:MAG TPA: VOC family protein [Thermohalobaculum sp.]|nr:VOC family protein [Thermohalobaculum sp.]